MIHSLSSLAEIMLIVTNAPFAAQAGRDLNDQPGIQGQWILVSYEVGGNVTNVPEGVVVHVSIAKASITAVYRTENTATTKEATYTTRCDVSPAQIDMVEKMGRNKGKTLPGIYKLGTKTLTICIATEPEVERPKRFVTAGAGKVVVVEMKRVLLRVPGNRRV